MIKLLRMMAVALCLVVLCPPSGGALAQTTTPPSQTLTATPPPGGACPVNTPMSTPLDPSWAAGCSACIPTPTPAGTRLPTFVFPTANLTPQGSVTPTITGTIYPTNTPTRTPTPGVQAYEYDIRYPEWYARNDLGGYSYTADMTYNYWPTCPSGSNLVGINVDFDWDVVYPSGYPSFSWWNQPLGKGWGSTYYSFYNYRYSIQAYRYEGYYTVPAGYTPTRLTADASTNFNGQNWIFHFFNNAAGTGMQATIHRLSSLCYGVPPAATPTPTITPQYGACNEYEYLDDDPIASIDGAVIVSDGTCYSLLASQTIDIPGSDTDISIPGLRLCPAWVTLPTFGIFGITIPSSIFALPFALYLVGLIMRI